MLELKLIYIWKKGRYDIRRCNYWWQKPPFYNFPCSVSDDKTVSTTTFPYQWPSPPSSLLASYLTVATHSHLALYHLDVLKLDSPQHAPDFLLFLVLPVTGERRKGNLKELPVPSGIVTYTRGKGYIWCSISENKRCLIRIMNCYGITLSEKHFILLRRAVNSLKSVYSQIYLKNNDNAAMINPNRLSSTTFQHGWTD